MYRVKKRDGELVDFNIAKISDAIKKAFEATGTEYNDSIIVLPSPSRSPPTSRARSRTGPSP